jgi:hypothetical protein
VRVFENRVLSGMFGQKREEVTGKQRMLHNEGLNNSYSSPNIIRKIKSMRGVEHVASMREDRKLYSV